MFKFISQKPLKSTIANMNGVDRSDQIIGKSTALRKCMWKTLLFHFFSFTEVEELKRPQQQFTTEFRKEVVRQLAGIEEYVLPPAYNPSAKQPGEFEMVHIPQFG